MSDAEVLAEILRRWVEEGRYWSFNDSRLVLDGEVDIGPDEAEALERILGQDGQGWWRRFESKYAGGGTQ